MKYLRLYLKNNIPYTVNYNITLNVAFIYTYLKTDSSAEKRKPAQSARDSKRTVV